MTNHIKGRGTGERPDPRYLEERREPVPEAENDLPPATTVTEERARSILSRNDSPDVPFEASVNPYRGCEHGCIYCYARPTHAWLELSPGIDFETRLYARVNAARLLAETLASPRYRCVPIALGSNTDPYQPVERRYLITRQIIELLSACSHPLVIVTKSSLIERDLDVLADMAARRLVRVYMSVTTVDRELARRMEPRASEPGRRLETIARLVAAGIPTGVLFAPVIPFLNDMDMETVLERAMEAGAGQAEYVMLRLPHEVKDLFREWLQTHYPLKAAHIMNRVRDLHGGRDYDPRFGKRMSGQGIYAGVIRSRFETACRRLGLNREHIELDITQFIPPVPESPQMSLW